VSCNRNPYTHCALGIRGCAALVPHEHSPDTMTRGSLPGVEEYVPGAIVAPSTILVLPTDAKERKAAPVWTGVMMYFPAVWAEVAKVSKLGNDQHNPGQPLHWERGKSTDQMDSALRHMIDHGSGTPKDTDGAYHLAKAIWRLCAELQLQIEADSRNLK